MTALRSLAAAALAAGAFACLPPVAGAEHSLVSMVSTGPAVGPCPQPFSPPLEHLSCVPRFQAASADGKRVFFSTAEPLVADDVNREHDLYVREGGVTQRITRDRGFGESNFDGLVKASRDGTRVLFHTRFAQVPEDNDFGGFDVYEWSDAGVRPLLPNPSATHSTLAGISQDAAQVFVLSSSKLVSEDTDLGVDLYAIEGTAIELVSTGPLDGARNVGCACNFAAVSDDGRRVFFTSGIGFTAEDTDSSIDLYERFDGRTELVSKGTLDPGEEGWFIEQFRISPDGSHVYFTTPDRLLPEATPDPSCIDPFEAERHYPCIDLYERTGGVTRLVAGNGCTGCDIGLVGATSDGSVFFTTPESLSPGDTGGEDIYRDQAGEVTIAGTRPPGTFLFRERAVTKDGAHVFFKTRGSGGDEIYEHFAGETRKVTTGPLEGARCCDTALYPELLFVSEDGKRAFFATNERLVAEDPPDGSVDVYERHAGVTTLVSRRVDGAPFDFRLSGAAFSADGKRAYLGSRHPLVAEDTDQAVDLYEVAVQGPPDCSGARATTATLDKRRGFTVVGIEGVTDPEGDPVEVHIDGVTQDEPVRAKGDPTTPDARLLGATAALRAERNPKGDGRVYHVAFTATDDHGGECSGEALVAVPRHKHRPAVDSAPPAYDSLGG